jgi:Ca2+-binding RTX toxin-like protein
MGSVTVLGSHSDQYFLHYDAKFDYSRAKVLASQINTQVLSGALVTVPQGAHPPLTWGSIGDFVQTQDGKTKLPYGYNSVVDVAPNATIQGSGGLGESVMAGAVNLNFSALKGSGTIVAGGGNDSIHLGQKGGSWDVTLGNGNDTISAMNSGNDTIGAGSGKDYINLGSGNDLVRAAGDATVFSGSGNATLFGGHGLNFVGGSGDASVKGGIGGNNTFTAGSGNETLIGGNIGGAGGTNIFTFDNHAAGSAMILDFTSTDMVKLKGYGPNEVANAINHQLAGPTGVTITLSDNTKITFAGVTQLDPKNFTT